MRKIVEAQPLKTLDERESRIGGFAKKEVKNERKF